MAGIMWYLPSNIYIDSTMVYPSTAPLSVEQVDDALTFGRIDYISLPPSVLTGLCKQATSLQKVESLQGVSYAGGPLPQETGDMLCHHVPLYADYGSTEMCVPPISAPDQADWKYLSFNEEWGGLEFRPAGDDLYELVIVRRPHLDLIQAIFVTFPDLQEYPTKDLFFKHPEKEGLWKYASRRDDIIVYSSGEKMNPVTMEGTITASPDVTGCLVVGAGRAESALLIEAQAPPASTEERLGLIDKIWPHIERANESTVTHGRVAKDRIIFTTTAKPLLRAGKGTVQRGRSLDLYETEIEELYSSSPSSGGTKLPLMDLKSHSAIVESLQNFVATKTGLDHLPANTDFFRAGLDSVQVIELTRTINANLDTTTIEPKQVYDNPTAERLAAMIDTAGPGLVYDSDSDDDIHLGTWTQMQQMYRDVTDDFPSSPPHWSPKKRLRYGRVMALKSTRERKSTNSGGASDESHSFEDGSKSGQSPVHNESPESKYLASSDAQFLISMLPPDGGRTAWLHVFASFLINFAMWGLLQSFAVYLRYYKRTFLRDRSLTAISWIVSVQAALMLGVGVFSGTLFDKGYFRSIVLIAGLGMTFAIMMLSLAHSYYEVMLCQGVLLGFCSGLLYIPSLTIIPLYFKDRRGLAFGLALAGASIGGIVYPAALRRLLEEVGFGWATRILGFTTFTTLGIVFLITKPLPMTEKPSREFVDLSAMKELPFLAFMVTGFLSFCAFLIPHLLTPTFAITDLKKSENTGSYLICVINAAQLFGQIGPAWLSDYFGGEVMLAAALLFDGILGFCWISADSTGRFVSFLVFYGFFSGMIITLPPIVMPYVCPSLAVLGTRLGMVYAAAGLGALVGAPIAVAATTASGGFLGAQLWVGCCITVAAVLFSVTAIAAYQQRQMNDSKRQRLISSAFVKDAKE